MSPLAVSHAALARLRRGARDRIRRRGDLDWLRGLMLLLMTVTHLPTVFSARFGQPFGFVSAAEGFVFLSAFLVGSVYGRIGRERGDAAMRNALLARTAKVYGVHVGLLLFLFFVLVPMAASRGQHAITDLASFYLQHPMSALTGGLTLLYNPPLLDILPMYVIFLAVSPWILSYASRHGWRTIFAVSVVLWLAAQFDAGRAVYQWGAAALDLRGDYAQTGAFVLLAWQLLWFAGLCAGARPAANETPEVARVTDSRVLLVGAIVVVLVLFVWRHIAGQVPFPEHHGEWNRLFDKWHLGPLRIVNFAALALLAVHGRHVLMAWAQDSSIAQLGRASLAVFAAHLVICLTLLATLGDEPPMRSGVTDAALLTGCFATLYVVARIALRRAKSRKAAGGAPRGAPAMSGTAR